MQAGKDLRTLAHFPRALFQLIRIKHTCRPSPPVKYASRRSLFLTETTNVRQSERELNLVGL